MEHHQDEHIACADCGASFLFSAGEAAVFEERGLAAPKRCKDCRKARKDQKGGGDGRGQRPAPRDGGGWGGHGARQDAAPRGGQRDGSRAPRQATPRYTGDVNEYRSPMADGGWQQRQGQSQNGYRAPMGNGAPPRGPRRGGPGIYRDDGQYRAPMGRVDGIEGHARAQGQARAERPRKQAPAGGQQKPRGEMYPITCNACGADSEVPFKPAEGREVFCQACYRARKPPV